jgi:hypothetical protein
VIVMSAGRFWGRNRPQSEEETEKLIGALPRVWRLKVTDRCDRCGAQAYVRVMLPGRRELLFCAHHNRQHASALAKIAVEILDETQRLSAVAAV